jgi:hypothetical protein
VDDDTITAIEYDGKQMKIFVNDNFHANEFNNYNHILSINHIVAFIDDYKSYVKTQKDMDSKSANSTSTGNMKISADTKMVITE